MNTIKRELLPLVEKHHPMKYWNTSYKREFGIRKLGISKNQKGYSESGGSNNGRPTHCIFNSL